MYDPLPNTSFNPRFQDIPVLVIEAFHKYCFGDTTALKKGKTIAVDLNDYRKNRLGQYAGAIFVEGPSYREYFEEIKGLKNALIATHNLSLYPFGQEEAVIEGAFTFNENLCLDPCVWESGLAQVKNFPIVYANGNEHLVLALNGIQSRRKAKMDRFEEKAEARDNCISVKHYSQTSFHSFKYSGIVKKAVYYMSVFEKMQDSLVSKIVDKFVALSDKKKYLFVATQELQDKGLTLEECAHRLDLSTETLRYMLRPFRELDVDFRRALSQVLRDQIQERVNYEQLGNRNNGAS